MRALHLPDRPCVPRQIGRLMTQMNGTDQKDFPWHNQARMMSDALWAPALPHSDKQLLMLKTVFTSAAPLRVARSARIVPFRRSLITAAAGTNSMVKATWSE